MLNSTIPWFSTIFQKIFPYLARYFRKIIKNFSATRVGSWKFTFVLVNINLYNFRTFWYISIWVHYILVSKQNNKVYHDKNNYLCKKGDYKNWICQFQSLISTIPLITRLSWDPKFVLSPVLTIGLVRRPWWAMRLILNNFQKSRCFHKCCMVKSRASTMGTWI